MITADEISAESRRTGQNETIVRQRLEMAESLTAPKAILRAREKLATAEAEFAEAVQEESDLAIAIRNTEDEIRQKSSEIGNGEVLLAAAKEFCEGFDAAYDTWSDVIRYSASGAQALENGELRYGAMQNRIQRMPESIERKRQELHDLKAALARLKADAKK